MPISHSAFFTLYFVGFYYKLCNKDFVVLCACTSTYQRTVNVVTQSTLAQLKLYVKPFSHNLEFNLKFINSFHFIIISHFKHELHRHKFNNNNETSTKSN